MAAIAHVADGAALELDRQRAGREADHLGPGLVGAIDLHGIGGRHRLPPPSSSWGSAALFEFPVERVAARDVVLHRRARHASGSPAAMASRMRRCSAMVMSSAPCDAARAARSRRRASRTSPRPAPGRSGCRSSARSRGGTPCRAAGTASSCWRASSWAAKRWRSRSTASGVARCGGAAGEPGLEEQARVLEVVEVAGLGVEQMAGAAGDLVDDAFSAVGSVTRARSPWVTWTMPSRSSACSASRTAGRPTW